MRINFSKIKTIGVFLMYFKLFMIMISEEPNKLKQIIENLYGSPAVNRINKRLIEKYGLNFEAASNKKDMLELNDILREEFNHGYDLIINEYLKTQIKYDVGEIILNKIDSITDVIIEFMGDRSSLKILNVVIEAMTVYEICHSADITLSTAYRKIDELISIGLIIKIKTIQDVNGKRQGKYIKTFERINIEHTDMYTKVTIFPKPKMEKYVKKIVTSFLYLKKQNVIPII